MDTHSDHHPIRTVFDLHTIATEQIVTRNWDKTDLKLLRGTLAKEILTETTLKPANQPFDNSRNGLDAQVIALITAIRKAIEVSTPYTRICARSKAGFTKECKEASRHAKRLRRSWQSSMDNDDWEDYKMARNQLGRIVKNAMKIQFRKETTEGCESASKIWSRCKWIHSRTPQEACIPALYSHPPLTPETKPERKAKILLDAFFPPPPYSGSN